MSPPETLQRHPSAPPLVQDFLADSARRLPAKVALVCDGERVTYRDLDARADTLAHVLADGGVARGDRVVVFADNTVEAVVAYWATLKAGAVTCVINSQTRAEKLARVLDDSGASALVSDRRHAATFADVAAGASALRMTVVSGALDPDIAARLPGFRAWDEALSGAREGPPPLRNLGDDLASILYSSGTTGEPKAVMLSHRNMLAASASIAAYLGNAEDDVVLSVLPLSLSYGVYQMLVAFRTGATLVLERSFAYPAQVLARMAAEKVTGFAGVPMIFAVLLQTRNLGEYDLSRLRYLTNAAAALPVPHLQGIRERFPHVRFYSMYGQTECARISYLPPEDVDRKPASIGVPIPGTEFWILDENGGRAAPNQVGELVVRGPHVMVGYWRRPEATAERVKPGPVPGERVLHTGDLCRMDEEGYLYFVSRMDDIIKCRGEKVSPREVENVIAAIPGVSEVAVVGVPDELLGQAVKAFVVPREGSDLSANSVRMECEKRLESFMVPKYVTFVTDLPRTDGGKVKKSELQ